LLRFATDENVESAITRGLRRRYPNVNVLRIQDAGLRTADDPTVLAWAARENRLFVSKDAKTIPAYAFARVRAGLSMPGIVLLRPSISVGQAIEDLSLLARCSIVGEWAGQVIYLPL